MTEPVPQGYMRCPGIIPDGNLAGKPCLHILRQPSAKVPVKRCPRCHTEHVFKRPT